MTTATQALLLYFLKLAISRQLFASDAMLLGSVFPPVLLHIGLQGRTWQPARDWEGGIAIMWCHFWGILKVISVFSRKHRDFNGKTIKFPVIFIGDRYHFQVSSGSDIMPSAQWPVFNSHPLVEACHCSSITVHLSTSQGLLALPWSFPTLLCYNILLTAIYTFLVNHKNKVFIMWWQADVVFLLQQSRFEKDRRKARETTGGAVMNREAGK